jgi:D-arabinose 1-dehydrogenase-like Zn-dependent alcohol dehydrogenase
MATTEVAVATMRVAQVPAPGADFQLVEREIPKPGVGYVLIKVQACGVCHSDVLTKEGSFPGIQYPRVPGHEVVGHIAEVGAGVSGWTKGQRVGIGWHGGHDGTCTQCRRGDFGNCRNMKIAGIGYRVAAIGRGPENAALAMKLGASLYIDSKATKAAEELQKLGGARVILATAPSSKAMSELIDGLGPNGKLMVIGADIEPIEVTPLQLIFGSRTIQGWASGTPTDSEDTLRFSELTGVRPMIETYPLEKAAEAYARMLSGDAQFRVVLTM